MNAASCIAVCVIPPQSFVLVMFFSWHCSLLQCDALWVTVDLSWNSGRECIAAVWNQTEPIGNRHRPICNCWLKWKSDYCLQLMMQLGWKRRKPPHSSWAHFTDNRQILWDIWKCCVKSSTWREKWPCRIQSIKDEWEQPFCVCKCFYYLISAQWPLCDRWVRFFFEIGFKPYLFYWLVMNLTLIKCSEKMCNVL